jgi:hypothetical protein
MRRIIYLPFSIVAGLVAGQVSRRMFRSLWARFDDAPPPKPGSGQGGMAKVVAGQAAQGAVVAGTAAAVDRLFARGFHHLLGVWPRKPDLPEPRDR